jgi:hypothetical protein
MVPWVLAADTAKAKVKSKKAKASLFAKPEHLNTGQGVKT